MGEIKLLGTAASPYTNRVQFVLNLKSIEYEFVEQNLVCKSELLLTSNPIYNLVPVYLQANKPPICESLVIIEYLDEIKPDVHRILPSVPAVRALNRFWANYIDTKLFPWNKVLMQIPGTKQGEAIIQQIIEGSILLEEAFVKLSNGGDYFGGDDIGYLDVVLGCFAAWTKFIEEQNQFKVFDDVRTPRLANWSKRIWSHEYLKCAIPGDEAVMNFYKMRQMHKPLT